MAPIVDSVGLHLRRNADLLWEVRREPIGLHRRRAGPDAARVTQTRHSGGSAPRADQKLLQGWQLHNDLRRWRREWSDSSTRATSSARLAAEVFAAHTVRALTSERNKFGGESGIRTHGRVAPTHAFQACSIDHSDISPLRINSLRVASDDYRSNCVRPPNVPRSLKGADA